MTRKQAFILLADDDPEDIELLSEAILEADQNTRLHTVNNGNMVLTYLNGLSDDELPSLIVLDYNMPGMNGGEVLKHLCDDARYEKIPKIVWSTSNNSNYIRECMEKGAVDYMVKPSTHSSLQEQAAAMLKICA